MNIDDKIRRTVIQELRRTQSPYIQPAWRTTLFLVEGLSVQEAIGVVNKLAINDQRGFDIVSKKLTQVMMEEENAQAVGS